jgi:glycosyltransferase involved in cell wall biosynthesis
MAGLPLLASRVGGNSEVTGSEAEIYDLDNAEEFLKKFSSLQDIDNLDKILKNNRLQAETFNLRRTADGYEAIYSNKI